MATATLLRLLPFAVALGVKYQLRVLSHLVSRQLAGSLPDVALPGAVWTAVLEEVQQMVGATCWRDVQMALLEATPALAVDFYNVHEAVRNADERLAGELEDLTATDTAAHIEGELGSFVEQLAQDYLVCMRQTDVHSVAYLARLQDEVRVLDLAERVQSYYTGKEERVVCRMALLRVRLL